MTIHISYSVELNWGWLWWIWWRLTYPNQEWLWWLWAALIMIIMITILIPWKCYSSSALLCFALLCFALLRHIFYHTHATWCNLVRHQNHHNYWNHQNHQKSPKIPKNPQKSTKSTKSTKSPKSLKSPKETKITEITNITKINHIFYWRLLSVKHNWLRGTLLPLYIILSFLSTKDQDFFLKPQTMMHINIIGNHISFENKILTPRIPDSCSNCSYVTKKPG